MSKKEEDFRNLVFDVLKNIGNDEYIIAYLEEKGYKVTKMDKGKTYSIDGLTHDQRGIFFLCLDMIRKHTRFDESIGLYAIEGEDISGAFYEEDYKILTSIELEKTK